MCESHLTLHTPEPIQDIVFILANVKQFKKYSQIMLSFHLVIHASVKYVLFLNPFCRLSIKKAIALSLFTILAAEIRLVQRQLFYKAV